MRGDHNRRCDYGRREGVIVNAPGPGSKHARYRILASAALRAPWLFQQLRRSDWYFIGRVQQLSLADLENRLGLNARVVEDKGLMNDRHELPAFERLRVYRRREGSFKCRSNHVVHPFACEGGFDGKTVSTGTPQAARKAAT